MSVRQPYADRPTTRGRLNFPPAAVNSFLRAALAAREQPLFHAVGDAAIDAVLDALEASGVESGARCGRVSNVDRCSSPLISIA